MKPVTWIGLTLTCLSLCACREAGTNSGTAGSFQTGTATVEGGTPFAVGHDNPFQHSGMPDINVAASREEAALDVSGAGGSELARRSAAADESSPAPRKLSRPLFSSESSTTPDLDQILLER